MPSPQKLSLHELYNCKCPNCGGHIEKLSLSQTEDDELIRAFKKAARWVFQQKKTEIQPDDLNEKAVLPLFNKVNDVLQTGFNKGIEHRVPYIMKQELSDNIFVFSGAKTYSELKELSELLMDSDGNIKPFNKFWQDVQGIHKEYNKNYLEAEYIFATQSAQMASKWNEFETDGDRYNLQYRTANDDRVRESHWLLHNITLPPTDPFWEQYFPPNGWRCRCTAVQVRKAKFEASDSQSSRSLGAEATQGKNDIFRFNPGKQKVIFPEHHPYLKNLTGKEKNVIKKVVANANEVQTKEDVATVISEINKEKNWFERGSISMEVTKKSGVNGMTDMNGKVWLKKDRMDNAISAINKLKKGEDITVDEADAMATLWHEITHNRSKPGNMRMTKMQTRYMELANEFVSRRTLPDFYESLGSKMQHPEFMINRKSTGYNMMVKNYAKIIEKTDLKIDEVGEKVKKHLFEEKYNDQKTGLTKALEGAKKADGTALKKAEINSLVQYCDQMSETRFEEYLEKVIH